MASPTEVTDRFESGSHFLSVKCGQEYTIVRTSSRIYGFGQNCDGQLGDGTIESRSCPVDLTVSFNGEDIVQISCGQGHTSVLTSKSLYMFGNNEQGQLGDGSRDNSRSPVDIAHKFKGQKIQAVECSGQTTFVATDAGLYMFGASYDEATEDSSPEPVLLPTKINHLLA